MLVVAGSFVFEPEQREEYLANRHVAMHRSRAEPGCLEYAICADPIDPGRVVLYERWVSQEHLDVHIAGLAGAPQRASDPKQKSVSIMVYDISGERPLR